jgi:hypothetical protein
MASEDESLQDKILKVSEKMVENENSLRNDLLGL